MMWQVVVEEEDENQHINYVDYGLWRQRRKLVFVWQIGCCILLFGIAVLVPLAAMTNSLVICQLAIIFELCYFPWLWLGMLKRWFHLWGLRENWDFFVLHRGNVPI